LDETREAVEYQREIDQLVSGSLTAEDEAEVETELEELLEAERETEEYPEVPADELPIAEPGQRTTATQERRRENAMLAS